MKTCVWLKPELVAQVEFPTTDLIGAKGHLRLSKFVGLREDKRFETLHED